jgi:beta-lactamase regulating signal transducer with metallopeptidase domain
MMDWLIDTLAWTAALIALVLILRRPVARHFGPQFAYALWALPVLRLVLPPLTLPAWMAPEQAAPAVEPGFHIAEVPLTAAANSAPELAAATPLDFLPYVLAAWLTGAVAFLVVRFHGYFSMRRLLLDEAVQVGEAGKVRLVETPRATAPLAFGVIDKVIALPPGFMALHDRHSRDLALAHELTHHRGHDLLANFAIQPLFALHWFNPLAWLGWRAMRRDQEAACDARVIAMRGREDRIAYANVIAGFAAGPDVSLAAPMACPVLGEKSIIHRLRSLNMSDISPRRRMAGRMMAGAALLALPLTASITYAAPEAPAAPEPPVAPAAPAAPPAPEAPTAPEAPEVEKEFAIAFAGIDEDGEPALAPVDKDVDVWVVKDKDGKVTRKVIRKRIVDTADREAMTAQERAELDEKMKVLHAELAEKGEWQREVQAAMAEARESQRVARIEMKRAMKDAEGMTRIEIACNGNEPVSERTTKDGHKTVMLCTSQITANALKGLKEARKAIAQEKGMNEEIRKQVLQSLDEQIANWGKSSG